MGLDILGNNTFSYVYMYRILKCCVCLDIHYRWNRKGGVACSYAVCYFSVYISMTYGVILWSHRLVAECSVLTSVEP